MTSNPLADPTCKPVSVDGAHATYVKADVDELRRRWREAVRENALLCEKLDRIERALAMRGARVGRRP
jgi:hypothetical protein